MGDHFNAAARYVAYSMYEMYKQGASLVVWHFHVVPALETWWISLIQVNLVSSAAVALVWLGLGKRLYDRMEAGPAPLLAFQALLV